VRILAISGSLRDGSTSTTLARALAGLAPPGTEVVLFDGLADVPPFDADQDQEGDMPPPAVAKLRTALTDADAVVIVTPEYAFGVPGMLKNALDWTVASGDFAGKPTAAISSSPSDLGGDKAHAALLLTLRAMQSRLVSGGGLIVPVARKKLDGAGRLTDPATIAAVRAMLNELARIVARVAPRA